MNACPTLPQSQSKSVLSGEPSAAEALTPARYSAVSGYSPLSTVLRRGQHASTARSL